jgi:hypothetical protein
MKRLLCILLVAVSVFCSHPSHADTLREIQPIAFGAMAITGAYPQSITIGADGSEHDSGGFLPLQAVRNGVYLIENLPANTSFTVSVADTFMVGQGTTQFDITDFTFDHNSYTTNGSGDATVNIGATLRLVNGTTYSPGAYRGTYDLVLTF